MHQRCPRHPGRTRWGARASRCQAFTIGSRSRESKSRKNAGVVSVRVLDRIRGREVLPRCAPDGCRGRNQRHPADGHRAPAISCARRGIL